jgi:sterol desaturase/sphingolipid hydroxylase (fatty acid hydroxylase superfamily)
MHEPLKPSVTIRRKTGIENTGFTHMSDYIIITLLTLVVYYPLTLGVLALMMIFAWRQRKSPYWRLGLVLLTVLFVLFAMAAYDWYHYR